MDIEIFQICYTKDLLTNLPESFSALDNSENLRPDWREYWPIRNYLLNNKLKKNTLYGFFSPKFFIKTNLNYSKIQKFITSHYNGEDLVSFSPFWDLSTYFRNSFEQGEFFQPGLINSFDQFLRYYQLDSNLLCAPSPMERTIFCNYFLATKEFWHEWLILGEKLFQFCENKSNLDCLLLQNTRYDNIDIPMKIFIQERLADYILIDNANITNLAYDSFSLPSSVTPLLNFREDLITCNALKYSLFHTKNNIYYNEYFKLRQLITIKLINSFPQYTHLFSKVISTNFEKE